MTEEPQNDPHKIAYSIQEFSKSSSIGRTKLYLAIKNGELKARKFGKRTLIEHQDGVDFIRNLPEVDFK